MVKVALASLALAVTVLLLLPPRYTASAVVMLEPRKNNVTDISAVLSRMPTDPASVQNQIQILTSRDLAGRVIDRLGLASDPEFKPSRLFGAPVPSRERDAVIDVFLKRLSVDAIGLSTSLNVRFTSRDAEKSARIANAIADTYTSGQMRAKEDATAKTTQWLMERIKRLAAQVQASEEAVQQYKAEHQLNDLAGGNSLADQQMSAIGAQLVAARAELAEKRATYGRVSQLVREGRAADVSQVVASPLIAQLRAQESDLIQREAEYAARYGPKHPKMAEIESQKKNLEAKITQEVRRVVETAANDVSVAQAQVVSLEASLKSAEHESADDNLARVKLKSLEANAASTRSMYQAFVARLRATQDSAADEMPDTRVISAAAVPAFPDGPPKILLLAASLPASLLLGLLAALIAERLESVIVDGRTIAVAARIPKGKQALCDAVSDAPESPQAKAALSLAARLAPMGTSGKAILIAPADASSKETGLALAIARAAAANGRRVILIDGNFRTPNLARSIGITNQRGLVAALTGRLRLSECVFRDTKSNVLLLACSNSLANPAQILASPALVQLVAHLRSASDLVLIDSGPVLCANDASLLARLCDMALIVTHRTPKQDVKQAVSELAAPKLAIVAIETARAA